MHIHRHRDVKGDEVLVGLVIQPTFSSILPSSLVLSESRKGILDPLYSMLSNGHNPYYS